MKASHLHQLKPEVVAFVRSEWSTDWMPEYLDQYRVAPPAVAPFG